MLLHDLFDEFPRTDGEVVPLALQQLLREPLDVFSDRERAERLLRDAHGQLPERLEIAVALYKMYAYANRFDDSLALIEEVLERAATAGGFAADWRALDQRGVSWREATGPVRFYLYTLKALGFVLLRKGELATAREALEVLSRLDPGDQVGGSVVRSMAERLDEE